MAARPADGALRAEVAVLLGAVMGDLAALERVLTPLKQAAGTDEKVVEALLVATMAARAIGPVAQAWDDGRDPGGSRLAETVGQVVRAAVAAGRAQVQTQAGRHLPAVSEIPARGAAGEAEGPSPCNGVVLYWLENRGELGGFAVAGADLVALLRAARVEQLGGQTGSRLLAAVLDSGAILPSERDGRWSQPVRVAGRSRRLVVLRAEVVFPPGPSDPEGQGEVAAGPAAVADGVLALPGPGSLAAASPGAAGDEATPSPPGGERSEPGEDRALAALAAAGLVDAGAAGGDETGGEGTVPAPGRPGRSEERLGADRVGSGGGRARRPPRANITRDVLPGPAVLAPDRLVLPGGREVPVDSPVDVDRLAAAVLAGGARGVMVHRSAPDPTGLPEPPEGRPMQTVRTDGGRSVTIVLLDHDTQNVCGPWRSAETVEDLVAGLERFRGAVGHPWRSSVGRTGEALLRWTHPPDKGGTQLGRAPDVPEPATDGSLEPAYLWHRPLDDRERGCRWVHLFDKNSQYLAVWESVELGLGEAEHHGGPVDIGEWVKVRPSGARLVAPPGLWRVALPDEPIDETLPNAWGNGRDATVWVTTPTLARAFEVCAGDVPAVSEAWLWPEHSRYLRATAERLRDARSALLDDPTPPAQLALAAVKDLYRRGTGRMAMGDRNPNSGWPRPDWRLAIIAQARVNLHRTLAKLTVAPFAVLVDGLSFASDEPDPTVFAAAIGLPVGAGLGQFSYKGTADLTPLLEGVDRAASPAATFKLFQGATRGSG